MRFPRRLRAPGPPGKRPARPCLESLETRLVMSAAAIGPAKPGGASSIVVEPALKTDPGLMLTMAIRLGSNSVGADSFGAANPQGYTPQQIRAAYGINNISFGSIAGDGTGQTIAIVDAFDDPNLVDSSSPTFSSSDLARFDQAFGLPDPPSFVKLNEYGSASSLPGTDPSGGGSAVGNWELEEALDVEWAHAIAPGARIDLIETNSDSGSDMYAGVTTAAGLPGVSVVSMSWGSSEFSGEQTFDTDFTTPSGHQGVTFVASAGDLAAPGWYPAYSPNVVAAGGTTLALSSSGSVNGETAWSEAGGGASSYEHKPAYQQAVQDTGMRTIPDLSFDANPATGVAIYDSYDGTSADPWQQIGGTSMSAPCLAGVFAIADQGRVAAGGTTLDGRSQTLSALYTLPASDYHDVTSGSNGSFAAKPGYDDATGLGTPRANFLVPDLAVYGIAAKLRVTSEPPSFVTAGNAFGLSLVVENSDGSRQFAYNGSVTVTLANNPAGASAGGTVTVLAQAGIATFSDLTLDRAGVGYMLILDAGGTAFATSSAISVSPAPPARLVVISEPLTQLIAGAPFGLTVAIEDNFGNVLTSYSGTVTVAPASGPGRIVLGGTRTVAINQGLAVFSGLMWKRPGKGYAVKVTSTDNRLATAKTTVSKVRAAEPNLVKPRASRVHSAPRHKVGANVRRTTNYS